MMTRFLATALLAAGLPQAALAVSDANKQPSNSQSSTIQNPERLPDELRQRVTDAGFTDVKVVPSSFVVQAKNKAGHPVLMQISPDSMTILTAIPVNTSTTGSGPATATLRARTATRPSEAGSPIKDTVRATGY
jgi:hypothetical protein